MNTKKYLKYSILPLALMLGGLAFTACTDAVSYTHLTLPTNSLV